MVPWVDSPGLPLERSELRELVVFDLETTGLSPQRDQIIQIAAIRLVEGEVDPESAFFSYVDPGRPISAWITSYTGIRNADVKDAPRARSVLKDFSRYVGPATLVAHNGHRFDMKFIAAGCQQEALPSRTVDYLDSVHLSRRVWEGRGVGHGLDAVLRRLDISLGGMRRHDARGDVLLLAKAVQLMWRMTGHTYRQPPVKLHQGILPL